MCIPKTKECDSTRDCPNGEDEHGNCSKLPTVLLEMSGQILGVTICCVGQDWIWISFPLHPFFKFFFFHMHTANQIKEKCNITSFDWINAFSPSIYKSFQHRLEQCYIGLVTPNHPSFPLVLFSFTRCTVLQTFFYSFRPVPILKPYRTILVLV